MSILEIVFFPIGYLAIGTIAYCIITIIETLQGLSEEQHISEIILFILWWPVLFTPVLICLIHVRIKKLVKAIQLFFHNLKLR